MNSFMSGLKGTFSARALGAWAGVFLLLAIAAYIGFTPESVAARAHNATGG